MKYVLTSILLCLAICAGCSHTNYYIVSRDVPSNPSFVVIPFNFYKQNVDAANIVENALLASRVRVVERPGQKEVEMRRGAQKAQANSAAEENAINRIGMDPRGIDSQKAEMERIERYFEYEDIKADYIVHTSPDFQLYRGENIVYAINVRIVKKDTKEVIAAAPVIAQSANEDTNNILHAAGLAARLKEP